MSPHTPTPEPAPSSDAHAAPPPAEHRNARGHGAHDGCSDTPTDTARRGDSRRATEHDHHPHRTEGEPAPCYAAPGFAERFQQLRRAAEHEPIDPAALEPERFTLTRTQPV